MLASGGVEKQWQGKAMMAVAAGPKHWPTLVLSWVVPAYDYKTLPTTALVKLLGESYQNCTLSLYLMLDVLCVDTLALCTLWS